MANRAVAYSLDELRALAPRNAAVTLGVFDGVHSGHKEIIAQLIAARGRADIDGCYLISFAPHPLVVTHSRTTPPMLTTVEERVSLLSQFDLDGVLVLEFDEGLANLDYRVFLEKYLVRAFDMKLLILGYDCYFGKNREGSPERVQQESKRWGFDMRVVSALRNNEEVVSSTKIRNALMEGNLRKANVLLGHPYLISGVVVGGHGKGRGLGFPTANLSIADPYKLWPPRGVYAVRARHGERTYDGMMNVGNAPTIKGLDETAREVEVHLFDFAGELYGEKLFVSCHEFLREEKKFPSPEALVQQLRKDREAAVRSLK